MKLLNIKVGINDNSNHVAWLSNDTVYFRFTKDKVVLNQQYLKAYPEINHETQLAYIPIIDFIIHVIEHETIHQYLYKQFNFRVSCRFDETNLAIDYLKSLINPELTESINAQLEINLNES